MDFNLAAMEAFVKAVETGSFAAAARALDVSPQMVAKHVAALERRLGARLLNRTTRKQALTELGHAYHQRCRLILEEVLSADALAQTLTVVPRGVLRISAPITFGTYRVVQFLADFMTAHPDIEVDLVLTDRLVDLTEEGFEAVFRLGDLPDSSLAARALEPYRLIACASPRYLDRHGVPDTPEALTGHACINFIYARSPFEREWQFARDARIHKVKTRGRLRVNEGSALLSSALAGHGVVLAPEMLVEQALQQGRLIRVLPDYEGPSRPLHLIFDANRQKTARLRTFIEAASLAFGPAGRGA
ncbi:LysR family transcriptional regulator [Pseudoxanthomonas sp. JBR18]|uniref:LysR family transcriptional regulator n=1 Tax=Pseudoxanthomonas sp. JBR18 TaxID=2969308 RepID=UPI00230626D4|nr:LysR family transcriptional regulator [Pseudoxanthomonas sp. JBR18]WCE04836.1 LysR family transcriptional regulator [Pseudoxanthomonas sp. JBR18]